MTENPYLVEGPALISFSGGRTSGYMLQQILDAHGGLLPDDVHVCFANTGKERGETLRFVHECGSRWGVAIHWLEYQERPKGAEGRLTPHAERYAEVGYNSASRNGEPLTALFDRKGYLPNVVTRFCTADGKIGVMTHFMRAQGYTAWTNVVGLRWDEMHRVFKQIARNESGKERWRSVMPMARQATQVREEDIFEFWFGERLTAKTADWDRLLSIPPEQLPRGFDLGLRSDEGNCDLCFLKGRKKLVRLIRENPGMADWWVKAEAEARASKPDGARFRRDYTYAQLVAEARDNPLLPLDVDDDEHDAECGLWCAGEAA